MAGYGQLLDYEPAELPGSYRFLTKDGRKVFAAGPSAEAMKARLDEAKAMGPQPTAQQVTPGSRSVRRDVSPVMVTSTPGAIGRANRTSEQMAAVRAEVAASKARALEDERAALEAKAADPAFQNNPRAMAGLKLAQERNLNERLAERVAAKPPSAPPPAKPTSASGQSAPTSDVSVATPQAGGEAKPRYLPYMTNERGDDILLREGGDPNNPADILVREKPRAGSRGGWRTTSQTVRGGYGVDNEFLAGQDYIHGSEQAAVALGQEAADAEATAQAAYNERMLAHQVNAEEEAKARADAIAGRVQELDDRYERLNKEYNSAGVDPRRMFAGGKNWLYALFAGMSTFGAGLSRTPNVGVQILQQRIADDIDAQRAEVAIKRDAADNAYKRLLQETGSSELAKKALEGIQLNKLKSEYEVMAKDGRDKKRQAQAVAMFTELDKQYALWKQGYLQAAAGEVTKQMVNVPGSGGSAGGIRTPRAGEVPNVKTATSNQKPMATSTAEKIAMKKSAVAALDRLDLKHSEMNRPGILQEKFGDSGVWSGEVDAAVPVIDAGKQGGAPNESTMDSLRSGLKSSSGDRIKRQIAAERQILLDQIAELEATAGSVPEAPKQ